MVRSFHTHSGAPLRPTRRCATKGERLESAEMTRADDAITGADNVSNKAPAKHSPICKTRSRKGEANLSSVAVKGKC